MEWLVLPAVRGECVLTFGDGNVLEKKDDSGDWELPCESRHQIAVNHRGTNVLKPTGNVLQNLDGVLARLALAMTAVEPRSNREHDNDKSISESREEEKQAFCREISEGLAQYMKNTYCASGIFLRANHRSYGWRRGRTVPPNRTLHPFLCWVKT